MEMEEVSGTLVEESGKAWKMMMEEVKSAPLGESSKAFLIAVKVSRTKNLRSRCRI